ncbi:hypothetical protein DVH05_002942 [Phytophthora capsici]|nr:hypothetical protein DVH05_002942 [Phytophthora capsici]
MAAKSPHRRRPVSWEKDGVGDGPSSVDVILKWITAEGNLQRWRGDTVGGKTKKSLASEIADLIKDAGITGRTIKGVLQKVNDIQDSYNRAADLKRQSGEGILDEDEAKTFHDKLVSVCKHWDVLDPVFHNRASSKPIAPMGTFRPLLPKGCNSTQAGGFDEDQNFDFPFDHLQELKSDDDEHTDTVSEEPKPTRPVTVGLDADAVGNNSVRADSSIEVSACTATLNPPSSHGIDDNDASKSVDRGRNAAQTKRGKSLTLKAKSQKKRKSLDDVMYDSIYERTMMAQKRSCIEMAQAKNSVHEGPLGVGYLLYR